MFFLCNLWSNTIFFWLPRAALIRRKGKREPWWRARPFSQSNQPHTHLRTSGQEMTSCWSMKWAVVFINKITIDTSRLHILPLWRRYFFPHYSNVFICSPLSFIPRTSPFRWFNIGEGLYFRLSSCRFRRSLEKLIALSRSPNARWRTKFPVFLPKSGVPGLYLCQRMIKSPRLTSARDRPIHSADAPPLPPRAAWIIYAQYRTWKRTFTPTSTPLFCFFILSLSHLLPRFVNLLPGKALRRITWHVWGADDGDTAQICAWFSWVMKRERGWDELYVDGWRMDPST